MPTVKLNRTVFEKLVGKKLPLDQLKERISMLGTDLENISEKEIDVEIFPNRPDFLSEQGLARAFSAFIGVKTGLREYKVEKSKDKVIIDKSLKKVRPYTACAIVKDLKFDDEKIKEIIQIQEKLHVTYGRNRKKAAIGIYPFENIKTPITFFAEDPKKIKFLPLEGKRDMTGLQILSQHPTGRDYGHLLEGMSKFPFFKDADGKILSMPPIINSHDIGKISEKTKDVFIECSGFNFEVLSKCLNMIVTALADMGGKIYSMDLEYPDKKRITPDLTPEKMKIDLSYINKWLGLDLKETEAQKLLEKMGYDYKNKTVYIPAWRADILHPVDIAEDIAIAYGYENFDRIIPKVATVAKEAPMEIFRKKIAEILVGAGIYELNTYHLLNKEDVVDKMNVKIDAIELANPTSLEYSALRPWMIPSLMQTFRINKSNEYPQTVFDIGTCFKKDKKEETGVKEIIRLAVATSSASSDYTEIKQILDYLMQMLDLDYKIKETEHSSFIPGRVGRVSVKSKDVAYIGEISPQVLDNWELDMPVAVFELNLTDLFEIMDK